VCAELSTDWCERFDFLENIDGIAVCPREETLAGGVVAAETTLSQP
jgi:hypothetical protein